MLIPLRRAGATYGAVGRMILLTAVAASLAAAAAIPAVGIVGVAVRDAANTFNTLPVGTLGTPPVRSTMYDAEGHVITYLYPNDIYRVPLSFGQIAPVMRNAIVAIEDSSFYIQGALDPRGTVRALLHNSGGGGLQGASTLAQQYVKNVRVLQAKTPAQVHAAIYPDLQRKIQQLRLAADVERQMSPDALLANYLNVAYFDNNAYGIQVAAQVYFSVNASQLTLPQAALLAGIVQDPSQYDPFTYPASALQRRSAVLTRMWQLHYIPKATALATEKLPLGLKRSYAPLTTGCISPQASPKAWFCDYVQHVLELDYPSVWNEINTNGGLNIYTTMNGQDQRAADEAVSYVQPAYNYTVNPGHNADTEVLLQPGTGAVRAIAVNRPYGRDFIDYAVNLQYGGGHDGVQTGSSAKIFTLITALEQGWTFGRTIKIKAPATVGPFYNCQGTWIAPAQFNNAEGPSKGTQIWMLNQATVDSINLFFVNLEKQVGLCNVVRTAVKMGMTRADGTNLLSYDPALGHNHGQSADDISSFTLGAVGVSPMSMAAAYASVAAGGIYCSPQALTKIEVAATGKLLPVLPSHCYRDMPAGVAAAANYILQGVLTVPGATAYGRGIPGHEAAAKTGTANSGYFAAFAGYTPKLAAYVSVFNPANPIKYPMTGSSSCYRDLTGENCPQQMYGDNAPGATWEYTFLRAALGADVAFPGPPSYFSQNGNGLGAPKTANPPKKKGGKGGGPLPPVSPSPTPTH